MEQVTIFTAPDKKDIDCSSSATDSSSFEEEAFDDDYLAFKKFLVAPGATLPELKEAIASFKSEIINSDECSGERKWFVRQLIELQLRVRELEDAEDEKPESLGYMIMGHHFEVKKLAPKKYFCDHCTEGIWNVMQDLYVCKDCDFKCHIKCVKSVKRLCVHIVVMENNELNMAICPEKGLSAQQYKCAECETMLSFDANASWTEPRLCDYFGLYFCKRCHWNNTSEIPARIVHNWDWDKYRVSQAAFQLINLTRKTSLINIEAVNPNLFHFVIELDYSQKIRKDLKMVINYLVTCKKGSSFLTPDLVNAADNNKFYSLADLELAKKERLESKHTIILENCRYHIINCEICSARGYLCEVCGSDEVLFPFDGAAVGCEKCNSYYHHACWLRKNRTCLKCIRIEARNQNAKCNEDDDTALSIE